ncbi:MAG TPA: chemotaxis protein CheB [Verrucomicrobiae bacterium]|jgi:two-component system, chemotaxis family, CheB/CheR fusion protein|nr:chemotaxis protein CheB [Verrucomicrobiae bacterium]
MPKPVKRPTHKKKREDKPLLTVVASSPFPIVAIGASAGGLEAVSKLLRALPPEPGIALVFIPHLDPTHESAMVELLSRTTPLPVLQASEGMRVACNCVYVLPPNSDMTISHGVLHLVRREAGRGQHMPIDTFFRSLAEDQRANAIGVILSGTANDGTLGLSAIKNDDGFTFAQDDSAKYDGMPSSAIAAGVVDFVLPPDRITQELIRIRRHPSEAEPLKDTFDGKDRLLKDIFRMLKSASKVDFVDYKMATIRRRILRRMNINQVHDLGEYVRLLQRNPIEVESLYRDVLINVTSFFRNPEVFESLRQVVYPKILTVRSAQNPVRVWVPGCSTGEETYSHAILLVEALSELRLEVPVQIFGTDLSETAIQRARAGFYKESIASDVSEIRLRRFFQKVPSGYQISKSIRDMCVFARQNVFSDPPFSRMDLISCRNVLIYLSPILQKKVIPIFHYALKQGGFLLVGNTEGLLGSSAEIFDLADRKSKIYQKKSVPSPVTFGLALTSVSEKGLEKPRSDKEYERPRTPSDVQREADRLLLSKYVPCAVMVNDDLEILQSRGRTNRFLELPTGKASLDLLKMVRPGLLYELRALIDKARKNSIPSSKEGIVLEEDDGSLNAKIEVIPFRTPARDQRHFLILFEEARATQGASVERKSPARVPAKESADGREIQIAQLKQELGGTKEYLQSIIEAQEATNEELQSANEEIQSGNEELQSTNEELQTSKEELESANEELNTVNEEIQHRNQQLAQLNNDLVNLLNSITIPMVMLSEDLHIRRYTPEAERIFGFSEHDVGKALTHLPLNLDVPQLERWMLDVMRDVALRTEQVCARDGKVYRLRVTPYRTLENKIEGVVLTLLDISDLVEQKKTAPRQAYIDGG